MGRSCGRVQGDLSSIGKAQKSRSYNARYSGFSSPFKKPAQKIVGLFFSIFLVVNCGCALSSKTESIVSPKIINSVGKSDEKRVIVHKLTQNFIDLEVPSKDVWPTCEGEEVEKYGALMGVYVLQGDTGWLFYYRRPVTISSCRADETQYRKWAKSNETLRIVGIFASPRADKGPMGPDAGVPGRFTNVKYNRGAAFVRMQAGRHCKSYFEGDCELPKNYWAGTKPD